MTTSKAGKCSSQWANIFPKEQVGIKVAWSPHTRGNNRVGHTSSLVWYSEAKFCYKLLTLKELWKKGLSLSFTNIFFFAKHNSWHSLAVTIISSFLWDRPNLVVFNIVQTKLGIVLEPKKMYFSQKFNSLTTMSRLFSNSFLITMATSGYIHKFT